MVFNRTGWQLESPETSETVHTGEWRMGGLWKCGCLVLLAGLLLAPVAALIALAALFFGLRYGMGAVEDTVKPWLKSLVGA